MSIMIQDSILIDPDVFALVYEDLKKLDRKSGLQLESASESKLDQLFQSLPKKSKGPTLENSRGGGQRLKFDVKRGNGVSLPDQRLQLEAIVRSRGRPALLIQGDKWQDPKNAEIENRLEKARGKLVPCFKKVGRIDGSAGMHGTGWLIEENLVVTNAHVATQFLSKDAGTDWKYSFDETTNFDTGDAPSLNQLHAARLEELIDMMPDSLDLAVFKIRWEKSGCPVEPLYLETKTGIGKLLDIAAIGYPKADERERQFDVLSNFVGDFQVKRLSPGKIIGYDHAKCFQHDCSTLGGSSGSPLINLDTGKVVGLHYGGESGLSHAAIKVEHLRKVLRK
jgi:endonuclease G